MLNRLLRTYLLRDAEYYPVLTLTGPRQSGKTTLARATFPGHAYVSLEDPDARQFARDDPRGFLGRYTGPVIIDEAQRVPDLFSYIQRAVDHDPSRGRFVLTGSHNFLLMQQVSQSLAGRCGVLHLLPFSRAELEGQAPAAPTDAASLFASRSSRLECWRAIWTGFYPPIHDRQIPPGIWLADYVRTYVERDVRTLVNIGDLDRFERFLALCAGRTAQLLSYSALAADCGIAVDTARRWISTLAASFLLFLLPPYHRNFRKRVIKSPKLYFHDTGLACYLLGIQSPEQLQLHPLRGALFENYVVAEVMKAHYHHRRQPALFFWRDQTGHEVDLLLEAGTDWYPVEIKSGTTVAADMLAGLSWWCGLAGVPVANATLVHGGDEAYERQGIAVRPWCAV
jgi:predicted AAA+ superfamily ATPase